MQEMASQGLPQADLSGLNGGLGGSTRGSQSFLN